MERRGRRRRTEKISGFDFLETSMSKLRLADCRPFFEAVVEKSNEMGVGVCSAIVNSEGHPSR
jgi:uncharacterized protein GlcG (DUF336 family)